MLLWELDSVEWGEAEGKGLCELLRVALRVPGKTLALAVTRAAVLLACRDAEAVARSLTDMTVLGVPPRGVPLAAKDAVEERLSLKGVPLPLAVDCCEERDVEVRAPVGLSADTLALALTVNAALKRGVALAVMLALAPSRESVGEALGVGVRDMDKELEVQAEGLSSVPVGVGRALADRENVVLAVVLRAPKTVASVAEAAVA